MKAIITDNDQGSIDIEKGVLDNAGLPFEFKQCKTEEDLIDQCQGAEILMVQYAPVTRKVLEALPDVKCIVRYGVGLDNIDVKAATELGIQVCNVPDYGVEEVSSHAIALSLALLRKLVPVDQQTKAGAWDYEAAVPLHRFSDLTVGVVGLGRNGAAFAKKMAALGFSVLGFAHHDAGLDFVKQVPFSGLLEKSDLISLHIPLNGNYHLFDGAVLSQMKPGSFIVNTSRGGLIDESALAGLIESGHVAGAGLDCLEEEPPHTDNPLLKLDSVIVTPHMAWYSEESFVEMKRKVAEEAVAFFEGKPVRYPVNHIENR